MTHDTERLIDMLASAAVKITRLKDHVAVLERDNTRLEAECDLWRRFFEASVPPMVDEGNCPCHDPACPWNTA